GSGSCRSAHRRRLGRGLVMLQFDCITLFPQMFDAVAEYGITRRAREEGKWSLTLWNPRDFTTDNYRTVDDRPYGGGPGMVMLAEPLEKAIRAARARVPDVPARAIYLPTSEERRVGRECTEEV